MLVSLIGPFWVDVMYQIICAQGCGWLRVVTFMQARHFLTCPHHNQGRTICRRTWPLARTAKSPSAATSSDNKLRLERYDTSDSVGFRRRVEGLKIWGIQLSRLCVCGFDLDAVLTLCLPYDPVFDFW